MEEFNPNFLDFEQPLLKIQANINSLKNDHEKKEKTQNEIKKLVNEYEEKTNKIFNNLTDWQIYQLARNPLRPYTLDYIEQVFTDFREIHGDRMFADDPAIITGLAKIEQHNFVFIGHQKGRDAKEKVQRNFGMAKPEGYRKALRVMKLAEKFNLPIVTFIDTPGAYPGIDAESRSQSQAIADNLFTMSNLAVPIICIIIGEGGSGGALAIGIGDKIGMLQYSIYSVISPEGCASILWKDSKMAEQAAEALCITAPKLMSHNLIDIIIPEPLGGAHRDYEAMSSSLKMNLITTLEELKLKSIKELLMLRKKKLESYGDYQT